MATLPWTTMPTSEYQKWQAGEFERQARTQIQQTLPPPTLPAPSVEPEPFGGLGELWQTTQATIGSQAATLGSALQYLSQKPELIAQQATQPLQMIGLLPSPQASMIQQAVTPLARPAAGVMGQLGQGLEEWGQGVAKEHQLQGVEITGPETLADPRFWTRNVAGAVTSSLTLLPVAVAVMVAGPQIAGAMGLGTLGTLALTSVGGGLVNRASESLLEAGGAYEEALNRGMSEEEAGQVADQAFNENMTLAGLDIGEFALTFAPMPPAAKAALKTGLVKKLGPVGTGIARVLLSGVMEGGEEGLQEVIQRRALGDRIQWDNRLKEAITLGGLVGGLQTGGAVLAQTALGGERQPAQPTAQPITNPPLTHHQPTMQAAPATLYQEGIGVASAQAFGRDPNKPYDFRYKIVSLDDLIPSHTDSLGQNPAYPLGVQPRLRDRAVSQTQINRIASETNTDALLEDIHRLSEGPMIVGPDNAVESGNGRVLGLRLARQAYPENFARYQETLRAKLPQYGLSQDALQGIKDPVLVRERLTPVEDRNEFAREANESATLAMSPLENALQDARRISDESVAAFRIGEQQGVEQALTSPTNQGLVRGFVATLSPNEQATMVDAQGRLNVTGLQRIKAALFAKTYPGETGRRLTEAFFESIDPVLKNVESGMFGSLPAMVRAEGLARSGQRHAEMGIGEDLAKAVNVLAWLKQQGLRVDEYIGQQAMFKRELTPLQERVLQYLNENGRSPRRIREFLDEYARLVEASPDPRQMGMFGDEAPNKEALIEQAIRRQEVSAGPLFGAEAPAVPSPQVPVEAAAPGGPQLERGPLTPAEPTTPVTPAQPTLTLPEWRARLAQHFASEVEAVAAAESVGLQPGEYTVRQHTRTNRTTGETSRYYVVEPTALQGDRTLDDLWRERQAAPAANVYPEAAGYKSPEPTATQVQEPVSTPAETVPVGEAPQPYNRERFRQDLVGQFGYTDEQAGASVAIADALAQGWAKSYGKDAGEWYSKHIAGVTREVPPVAAQAQPALRATRVLTWRAARSGGLTSWVDGKPAPYTIERKGAQQYELTDTGWGEAQTFATTEEAQREAQRRWERAVEFEGSPLYQGERGAVTFGDDGRAILHALSADASTAVHELAHVMRRYLEAPDLAIAEQWAGVEGGQWQTAQEEKFAQAFERYLADGQAPTPELQSVFEKFKAWLLAIYQGITGSQIDVQVSPEVRALFDRMLGGEPVVTAVPAPAETPAPKAKPVLTPDEIAKAAEAARTLVGEQAVPVEPVKPKRQPKAKPAEAAPPVETAKTAKAAKPEPEIVVPPTPTNKTLRGKNAAESRAYTQAWGQAVVAAAQKAERERRKAEQSTPSEATQAEPTDDLAQVRDAFKKPTVSRQDQVATLWDKARRAFYSANYNLTILERQTGVPVSTMAQIIPGAQTQGARLVEIHALPFLKSVGKDLPRLREYMTILKMIDWITLEPDAVLPNNVQNPVRALGQLEREIGPTRFAALKKAADGLYEVMDQLVRVPLRDAGRLSDDALQAMRVKWPHYVPMLRQGFDLGIPQTSQPNQVANVSSDFLRAIRMEGSDRRLNDPIVAMLSQIINTQTVIARNDTARALAAALITREQQIEKAYQDAVQKYGASSAEAKKAAQENKQLVRFDDFTADEQWDRISWKENGQLQSIGVPRVFALIAKGLESQPNNLLLNIMRQSSMPLRIGAVQANPAFMIPNTMRDAFSAWFREGLIPFWKDYWRGWGAVISKNGLYDEAVESGALNSTLNEMFNNPDAEATAKRLGPIKVKNAGDALLVIPRLIMRANEISEQATKVAVFGKLRAQGLGAWESAVRTRDSTVDFYKMGWAIRVLNQMIPFLNAGIQGAANTLRTIKSDPKGAALRASPLAAVSVLFFLANQRWETNDDIPEYEYAYNWILQIGEGEQKPDPKYPNAAPKKFPVYIKIPKGPAGAFLTAPVEAGMKIAWKAGDRSLIEILQNPGEFLQEAGEQAKEAGRVMVGAMSPVEPTATALLPPIASTTYALESNYDFFRGKPIVPEREMSRPPEERFGPETTSMAVAAEPVVSAVAQALGSKYRVSPRVIDFFIQDMTGGAGKAAQWTADLALSALGYQPEAPGTLTQREQTETETLAQQPVISRFLGTRATEGLRREAASVDVAVDDARRLLYQNPEFRRFALGVNPVAQDVQMDGQPVELSADQRLRYQRQSAAMSRAALDMLIEQDFYKAMADPEKRNALELVREKVQQNQRAQIVGELSGEPVKAEWTPAEVGDLIQAVGLYYQYRALPRYYGLSDEQIKAVSEATSVISQIARRLPPGTKNATRYATMLALRERPDIAQGVRLIPVAAKRRNPVRARFWSQNAGLLERYFGSQATGVAA